MYKMYFKLAINKINSDSGASKIDELNALIEGIDSYKIEAITVDKDGNTEHYLSTSCFGDESFLISLLEDIPWFMKYVLIWYTDDDGLKSDMIEVERQMGVQCSY